MEGTILIGCQILAAAAAARLRPVGLSLHQKRNVMMTDGHPREGIFLHISAFVCPSLLPPFQRLGTVLFIGLTL